MSTRLSERLRGRLAKRLRRLVNRIAVPSGGVGKRVNRARANLYDATQTSHENIRHWAAADDLSAEAANRPEVRAALRRRARYEVANNSYAKGMLHSLANYVIGTGPRLQMLTDDPEINRRLEVGFTRWADAIGLARKLHTMRIAQSASGEVFAVLTTNPKVESPVQLDLDLIETDRVTSPMRYIFNEPEVSEGIRFDEHGNPVEYYILRYHPGDLNWKAGVSVLEYDTVPAESVVHLFQADRPGQNRGVPEITPALPLFALLRRYTLAVVTTAEQAALTSGVIYTDSPADSDQAAQVDPLDQVELDRGTWMTMPFGWKVGQIKAEQPTTVYGDFKRQIITEVARSLNMPYNIAAGDSSKYNYASGRLDHQAFFKTVRINQHHLAYQVLNPILRAWINEAVLVSGFLPQGARSRNVQLPHQWFWDGVEHVDPAKEANAQAKRLENHVTTLAAEYARQGKDWEVELRQRAREVELAKALGLVEEKVEVSQ